MEQLNLPPYKYEIRSQSGRRVILDPIRKRFVPLTPEEWVRQHFIQYLIQNLDVPPVLTEVEVTVPIDGRHYRADIVVYNRLLEPILMVECKRPSLKMGQNVFDQIGHYNSGLHVPYLVVTNGMQHYCCRVDHIHRTYHFLDKIPSYQTMVLSLVPRHVK